MTCSWHKFILHRISIFSNMGGNMYTRVEYTYLPNIFLATLLVHASLIMVLLFVILSRATKMLLFIILNMQTHWPRLYSVSQVS